MTPGLWGSQCLQSPHEAIDKGVRPTIHGCKNADGLAWKGMCWVFLFGEGCRQTLCMCAGMRVQTLGDWIFTTKKCLAIKMDFSLISVIQNISVEKQTYASMQAGYPGWLWALTAATISKSDTNAVNSHSKSIYYILTSGHPSSNMARETLRVRGSQLQSPFVPQEWHGPRT